MLILRFDMRAPEGGVSTGELYAAALEMAEWAERNNALSVLVCEHHGSADGYIPSPLLLASAMAARTTALPIQVGALLVNFYDPIKLAEDIVVLDIISGGRVSYVVGLGYRPEEYAMFGVEMGERGATMDRKLAALLRAVRGERFDYDGRPVHVTPAASSPDGPMFFYGGHSPAAVRRAARLGLGVMAEGGGDELVELYNDACVAAGTEPGMIIIPPPDHPTTTVVATDVDAAWQRHGPYMLHDAMMYDAWLEEGHDPPNASSARTVDELRAEQGAYRVITPDEAVRQIGEGMPLLLQPLVGGCPPDLAWESLNLIETQVLPKLG